MFAGTGTMCYLQLLWLYTDAEQNYWCLPHRVVLICACFAGNITGWVDLSDDPCAAGGSAGVSWTFLQCTDGLLTGFNFTAVNLTGGLAVVFDAVGQGAGHSLNGVSLSDAMQPWHDILVTHALNFAAGILLTHQDFLEHIP